MPTPRSNGTGTATATAAGSPCPDCGEPRNPVNNRCYRCHPGGGKGRVARSVEGLDLGTTRDRPKAAPPPFSPAPGAAERPGVDAELAAISAAAGALERLPGSARRRALAYLTSRFGEE